MATRSFPKDFLWSSATAGHQVEGNNRTSHCRALEHAWPSIFAEPSGDAVELKSYRFGVEWARIGPEEGRPAQPGARPLSARFPALFARYCERVTRHRRGLVVVCRHVWQRTHTPILFTNNGFAGHDDARRAAFVAEALDADAADQAVRTGLWRDCAGRRVRHAGGWVC